MKKNLVGLLMTIVAVVLCASVSYGQADKRLKIDPNKTVPKESPKKLEVKPGKLVADAFFDFYGREPNSKEAEYWNTFAKNKTYTQDELFKKIQEKFLFPVSGKPENMDYKQAKEIILRAYSDLKKPAPEQKDVDYWLNRMFMATAYYRVMMNQMDDK